MPITWWPFTLCSHDSADFYYVIIKMVDCNLKTAEDFLINRCFSITGAHSTFLQQGKGFYMY